MTYSIVARDPETGELGVAVQSRYFAVGEAVPWIEAGVGVIASQAFANPIYGYEGLTLLAAGMEPQQALDKLLGADADAAMRQVAILDAQGRMAVYTGSKCVAAAGHAKGAHCCAQANMMARDTVWPAMVSAFESAAGDLADRLLAALVAAEHEGGDLRGRQASALIVASGTASGGPPQGHLFDLRVDDHPDPVGEIGRLLSYSRAHQRANQAMDKVSVNDFAGALADLDACYAMYPNEPEFLYRRALVLMALGRFPEARESLQQAHNINRGWSELLLRFADAGIIPAPRQMLEPLVASLT